jgi:putative transposase
VGYRKIAALLLVNNKRVERIRRREGLKVPAKQPKRGRLLLADGSCLRLRSQYRNHVWSYDFVEDRTQNGRKLRMLSVIDEFTHEAWRSGSTASLRPSTSSTCTRTCSSSEACRATSAPEFMARAVQQWITDVGAKTAYIAPGSPGRMGTESFNARLRDELLDGEVFYTLREAQIVLESWRRTSTRCARTLPWATAHRLRFVPAFAAWPAAQPRPAPPAMLIVAQRPTLN